MARIRIFTTQPELVRQHIALPDEAQIIEVSDLVRRPEALRATFFKWPPDVIGFTSDLAALTFELRSNPPEGDIGLAVSEDIVPSQELQDAIDMVRDSGAAVDIIVEPGD